MPDNSELNLLTMQHLRMLLDRNSDTLRAIRDEAKLTEDRIKSIKQEMVRRSSTQMELAL
jgi:hypothetical protein